MNLLSIILSIIIIAIVCGFYTVYLYLTFTRAVYSDSGYDKFYNHTAIIVIEYPVYRLISNLFMYCSGIHYLIQGLKNLQEPYIIYPCSNPDQFLQIINSHVTKKIWILGHGMRHGLKFEKDFLPYCECQNAPKKECIAQLHCNPFRGKSLADYLCDNSKDSFVTNDYRNGFENKRDIKKIIQKMKEKKNNSH